MKRSLTAFLLMFCLVLLATPLSARAGDATMDDLKVAVDVRGAGTYDYVLVGMNSAATEGFDNAFDTVTPGAGVADPYITAVIPHPDWNTVKTDFRTDFRSPKKSETWHIKVATNAASGTKITLSIDRDRTSLPRNYRVLIKDPSTGGMHDLTGSPYVYTTAGSPSEKEFDLIVDHKREMGHTK
jgi:microcompartment protein CcmK/EutM